VDKIISIESDDGPHQMVLNRVLRMVPDRDRQDVDLQRLLAFRLRTDGEGATREYLMYKIREMIQCAYTGRLYDFLKDDKAALECLPPDGAAEAPDIAE
jgi:hypothetical protein